MPVIVAEDGKYHGLVASADAARQILIVKEANSKTPPLKLRLLTDIEWENVVNHPDKRAELCASLGTAL